MNQWLKRRNLNQIASTKPGAIQPVIRPVHLAELKVLISIDGAGTLYAEASLKLTFGHNHPFESQRWAEAIRRSLAFVAVDSEDLPIGFVTLPYTDDEPLKQSNLNAVPKEGVMRSIAFKAWLSVDNLMSRSHTEPN